MTAINESEIKASINIQLSALGWRLDARQSGRNVYCERPKTEDEKKRLGSLRPDYVLYADPDSDRATVVIEAKRPNKPLAGALEQAKKYAARLNVPVAVATDGYRLKTWHLKDGAPLFLNDNEMGELFTPALALRFALRFRYDSIGETMQISKGDLIRRFKKANDILKGEGLSAGVERFSEFANLMFLKLRFEGGGGDAGHDWDTIAALKGRALLDGVKSVFSALRREHGVLFEQTKISSPRTMEKLVDILSSFRLLSIRGDIKGMAFEHFIHSYTRGTRNDLGQYFTPRHVIKMMVHFLAPRPMETIYDPFCGTGGMLIECFRYVSQRDITAAELAFLRKRALHGRDNSSVARIAMMNMIMFGDGHTNIKQCDSYARRAEEKGKYDIVITNIPFSQETAHVEGYPVAPRGTDKNGDSIGVQHCLESLRDSGAARAAIIVPIGFLHKAELREERRYIAENFALTRVVELTPKCFNPYTEQQTAVLMVARDGRRGRTAYYRVKNDGFSQDGYRVPVAGENDIDKTMEERDGEIKTLGADELCRYKTLDIHCKKGEFPLSTFAQVRQGSNISMKTNPEFAINGVYPIMMVADLSKAHVDYCLDESAFLINTETVKKKRPFLFPEHTVVVPTSGKASLLNHRAMLGPPAYLTSTLTGVIAAGDMHPFCLFYFFLNFDAESAVYDLGYPGLSASDLAKVPVPAYNERRQNEIIRQVGELVELRRQMKAKHSALTGGKR